MAEEDGVVVECETPEHATIHGNKKLIEELLTNLVVNAIKYRSVLRASFVRISLTETERDFVLQVADNGIGIPTEEIPELFTRFYRTTKTRGLFPGTGLGLSIVKTIADKHRASIAVESVVGERTSFSVSFPKIKNTP